MSASRREFTTEHEVEAAHRAIDSGRTIAEVARELSIGEQTLGLWVRDERRRIEAARGTENEPLTATERREERRHAMRPDGPSPIHGYDRIVVRPRHRRIVLEHLQAILPLQAHFRQP